MCACVLQLSDSDLTFDDVAVSPIRTRHKRQFWDTWGDTEEEDADYNNNYDEYSNNEDDNYDDDYNGDYDYNGDGGITISGDGLPPTDATFTTDDVDLTTSSGVGPRTGRPRPTAPTGLGKCTRLSRVQAGPGPRRPLDSVSAPDGAAHRPAQAHGAHRTR